MPELPHLPVAAQQATDQAKELARKGAHAATALLDASFHPFRTVRSMVQADEVIAPPPTDAQPDPVAAAEPPHAQQQASAPAPTSSPRTRDDVEAPADLPVVPTGPAPHMPPDLAEEIERDYGEDLPGFRNGDEPPGTH